MASNETPMYRKKHNPVSNTNDCFHFADAHRLFASSSLFIGGIAASPAISTNTRIEIEVVSQNLPEPDVHLLVVK